MKKILILLVFACIFFNLFSFLASGFDPSPYKNYSSYDDYADFLKTVPLPDDFVFYNDIKQVGDFRYFAIYRDDPRGLGDGYYFGDYYYQLKDATERNFILKICSEEDKLKENIGDVHDLNFNDMRQINNLTQNTVYYINGVGYHYSSYGSGGSLDSITWHHNGLYYTLYSMLHSYPEGTTTFVGKLLFDAGNARKTVDSLYPPDIDESQPQTSESAPQATDTTPSDDKSSGCGGFSVFAGFIALACTAGAIVLIKKK